MGKKSREKDHVVALRRAVELTGGKQDNLAAKLREFGLTTVKQQTISFWLKKEVLLDPKYWAAIEFATDGAVTRQDLRPDVFPRSHAA